MAGGRIPTKINYNSACDLERFQKFRAMVNNLSQVKKLPRLFSIIIKEIPTVIPSSTVQIFSFFPNLVKSRKLAGNGLVLQNTSLDGKFLDVIGLDETELADPKFKGFKEAVKACRNLDFLSHPVMNIEGALCLNLQVLAPVKRQSKYAAGFSNFDEIFLHLISDIVQAKLHQINAIIHK